MCQEDVQDRDQMKQLTASRGELSGGEQSGGEGSGEELMQEFERRTERQKESAGEVAKSMHRLDDDLKDVKQEC